MSPQDPVHDRVEDPDGDRPEQRDGEETSAAGWTPPARSDQAPGEEVVQVNDPYAGGGPPPVEESHRDDEQHPTGG